MTSMITDKAPIRFSDTLPSETDVVVIGAGIAGVATAYFLAKRGQKVVVCEKGRVAGEQSSRNWGWVRQQGRDWAELPIMMESNRIWRGLAKETGESDLAFTEAGCLYLADTEAKLRKFEDWFDLAKQHQLSTRMITADELNDRYPGIEGNWLGGMITDTDGRAEPFVAVPALARAAQKAGAKFIEQCAVRSLEVENGRVVGVVTEQGTVRAAQVVLAGGVWSTHFAANAGVSLPQLAIRSTVARTAPAPDVFGPNISSPGLALRRRSDGGYTVTSGDRAEHYLSAGSFRYFTKYINLMKATARDIRIYPRPPANYPGAWGMARRWSADEVSPFERMRVVNPEPSSAVVRDIENRLPQRFPALRETKLAEAWAGLIDVTPDAVPVLGEAEGLSGLYFATGLSGHGFGIGPAIGRIMADILTGNATGHVPGFVR
ncbi:MAG: FAD-binding oxidoreductase, partial [Pseudomonadota bacterium]